MIISRISLRELEERFREGMLEECEIRDRMSKVDYLLSHGELMDDPKYFEALKKLTEPDKNGK